MESVTQSKEDYLRILLELSEGGEQIRSIDIAYALGFSRASVSRMVKNLKESGFVRKEDSGKISLTERGLDIAIAMRKRRSLIRRFLVEVLGVEPSTAEKEACKMEHSISEETEHKLYRLIESINKGDLNTG